MPYALGIAIGSAHTVTAVSVVPTSSSDEGDFAEPPLPSVTTHDTRAVLGRPRPARCNASTTRAPTTLSLSANELDYVAAHFLSRVGDPVPLLGRGELVPELVTARVVEAAVEFVVEQLGERPSSIVVAHPGSWHGHRRQVLARALATFTVEPTAALIGRPILAALRYAEQTGMEIEQSILTVDIGTRTTECAVVRRSAIDTFEVVGGVQVDRSCGGLALDEALLGALLPSAGPALSALATEDAAAWRGAVSAAKEQLSSSTEATIPDIAGSGAQRMTRSEFDAVAQPVTQRIAEFVAKSVTKSVAPEPIAAVVLVGGTAGVSAIGLSVAEHVEPPVVVDPEPHYAVATGAAIASWFLALEQRAAADKAQAADTTTHRRRNALFAARWRRAALGRARPSAPPDRTPEKADDPTDADVADHASVQVGVNKWAQLDTAPAR